MIIFNEKNKTFLIAGKNYSYSFFVDEISLLQHLYYGQKIDEESLDYLVQIHGKNSEPKKDDPNKDMKTDWMPTEMGMYGRGDYHYPSLVIEREDGSKMSQFIYDHHKIISGNIDLPGLPHVRKATSTLIVTLIDRFSETEIDLNYLVNEDSNVLVRNMTIRNVGEEKIIIRKASSFCLDLPKIAGKEYQALRLTGAWARERKPVLADLKVGVLRLESNRGYSSHNMNPFIGILEKGTDEEHGLCYGMSLIYSGDFVMTAEMYSNESVRVQGGLNDFLFSYELKNGEEFSTPQAAICFSKEGLGNLSRSYHDFIRDYIVNPDYVKKPRPIVINNWEATYFNFDNEKIFALIDEAAELGIDTFVLDDGWFGQRDDSDSSLGDWFVNEEKLKGGLSTIINHCKEKKMKFGLWFEPEMISQKSKLFEKHPDWALCKKDVEPALSRNQLVLDLTKKEVVDYVYEAISKILIENDISYVKWDKNRDISEYFSDNLSPERQGELLFRYNLGFYELAQRLTERFKNIFFEGCAGGGGRFDMGALYYFPQIWTSDDTDGFERTMIQWGTSFVYPLSSMSCHVSNCPNHQTQRITPFFTRGAIASLGPTGYELDLTKLSHDEKEEIKEQMKHYKKIQNLILEGDLYRILNPFETNYFLFEVVSKDKTSAYVVGERIHGRPCDYDYVFRLQGLEEEALYLVEELGIKVTGKTLMNAGCIYPHLPDFGSFIWHIKKI